ncbi:hypothetical protein GCM10010404_92830 [Nonomuraea africana]
MIDALFAALQRVREHHVFSKGMGLAAPQIGIGRAAAIIVPPDPDVDPIVLLNPGIIDASAETDEQYEGCLCLLRRARHRPPATRRGDRTHRPGRPADDHRLSGRAGPPCRP